MKRIKGLSEVVPGKTAVLCDLWGVLHNGGEVFSGAHRALEKLKALGIQVILLSNSPKPVDFVKAQIKKKGADPSLYSHAVSSGGLVRSFLKAQPDKTFFFIGLGRDAPVYEGLKNPKTSDLRAADYILCTGFFEDWGDSPNQYEAFLSAAVENRTPFICANPDLEVFVGEEKVLCAGSLARLYERLGGKVLWFGKPEPGAYRRCFELLPKGIKKSQILAIGDNLETDIAGAQSQGIETVFITEGLHGKFASNRGGLEPLIKSFDIRPDYFMPKLDW